MIDVISLETAHILGDALPAMHRLRYRVFVQRQKYEVPTLRDMEWDQYDTPAAVYLLWRDEDRQVRAVTRLIPTVFPYMIKDLWPDLMSGASLPSASDVWEVTRLGVDRDLSPEVRRRAFAELVLGLYEFGLGAGVSSYLCVTPLQVINTALRAAGCAVDVMGRPKKLGGLPVIAARFPICHAGLQKLRDHHGIADPVLRFPQDVRREAA
jgi:acyl homoserine lactone synthase